MVPCFFRSSLILLAACLAVAAGGCARRGESEIPPLPPRIQVNEATLGPGDRVQMQVLGHDEFTREVTVPRSGVIFVPMAGEMNVTGMDPMVLRRQISERLEQFYVDPQVSLEVTLWRGQKITVLGEVNTPGLYAIGEDSTTMLDAIGHAGGFTIGAHRKGVILLRGGDPNQRYVVSLEKSLKEGNPAYNPQVAGGDILYVPPSWVTNMDRFSLHLMRYLQPIIQLEQGIILGYEAKREIAHDTESNVNSRIDFNVNASPN